MTKDLTWLSDWSKDKDGDFKSFIESLNNEELGDYLLYLLLDVVTKTKQENREIIEKEVLLSLVDSIKELRYQEYKQSTDRNVFAGFGVLIWNDVKMIVGKRFGVSEDDLDLTNPMARGKK